MAEFSKKLNRQWMRIFQKFTSKTGDVSMSIIDHLSELRKRLILIVVALLICVIVCCIFVDRIVQLMLDLGKQFDFVYMSPGELVNCYFRLVLIMALVLASPIILYQLWAFVRPALLKKEKAAVFTGLVGGLFFFCMGVAFAYWIAIPFLLKFFINFNNTGVIRDTIAFQNYMSFLVSTFLSFGLVFEFPMLVLILSKLGLVKPALLVQIRKYAFLIIFIIAAVITPPDISSQIMMSIPMMGLYELSIVLCRITTKRTKA